MGLVLGGGGVRGLAHLGVLSELEKAGMPPACVVGVSMGSVVAAVYAARDDWRDGLAQLDRRWLPAFPDPIEGETLATLRAAARSARKSAPWAWSIGRRGYEGLGRQQMRDLLGDVADFSETRIPAAMVATSLGDADRAVLVRGDLPSAALASAAIPGLAQPVVIDGHQLVDGGFADPVPVDVARWLGAEVVAAVDVGQYLEPFTADNWFTTWRRSYLTVQRTFARERQSHADAVLRPDFGSQVRSLDFSSIETVVDAGRAAAHRALPDLAQHVGAPQPPVAENDRRGA